MSITAAQLIAEIRVQGAEQARQQISSVGDEAEHAGGGLKNMLGNMLSMAGGFAAITIAADAFTFLKDQIGGVFTESMNAQDGLAQTVQVLKSTHSAAGVTADAVLGLADKYSHLTKFSDDTVQSSENMLLTFTNIGKKVFPDATKATLDMSQALGQDTKTSAIQLGKALNDPIAGVSALQRVGVTFSQTQKDQIKSFMDTNNVAGAQGVILKELQKEFGGSAEAAGKTFGGQMAILGQRVDDVKQKIGDALLPIVSKFVSWVSSTGVPLLNKFADWFTGTAVPALERFGNFLQGTVFPAVQKVSALIASADWGTVFRIAAVAAQGLATAFTFISNALSKVDWGTVFTTLGTALRNVGTFLQATFLPVWQQLVQSFNNVKTALQPIMPQLQQFAAALGGAVVIAIILVIALIAGLLRAFAQIVIGLAKVVEGVVQVFSGIVQVITGATNLISDIIHGRFSAIGADIDQIMHGILSIFEGIFNIIIGLWSATIGAVDALVSGFVQTIIGFFQNLASVIVGNSIVPDMVNAIVQWFAQLPGRALGAVQALLGMMAGFFNNLASQAMSGAQRIVSNVVSALSQMAGRAVSAVSGVAGALAGFFSGLAGQAMSWGSNIVNSIASGINGAIGAVKGAISNVAGVIAGFLPHSPAKEGPLRELIESGANISKQLGDGMKKGMPQLQTSMKVMLEPLSRSVPASALGNRPFPYQFPSTVVPVSTQSGGAQQPIIIQLDGYQVGRTLMPHITGQIRAAVGTHGI